MHLNEYQNLAARTAPTPTEQHFFNPPVFEEGENPNHISSEMNAYARRVDLVHSLMGLAGEVGEFIDPIKRAMFYGKELDTKVVVNLKEELGDCLWYIALACRALNCSMEDLAAMNISKLIARYPNKYTDDAALNRDVQTEFKALAADYNCITRAGDRCPKYITRAGRVLVDIKDYEALQAKLAAATGPAEA